MNKSIITYLVIIFFVKFAAAQITNFGEVYISENTDVSFEDDFNNTATGEFWNNGNLYAYGNWNNDGIVDFTLFNVNKGLTSFNGTNSQTISGRSFNSFYNVLFDNTSGGFSFNLQGDIGISNMCDFIFGIIDNKQSNSLFVFEQDSYHIGASEECHITGGVIKVGNDAFDYPIGNGSFYRSASISGSSSNNDIYRGAYFFENTNSKYPINNLGPNLILVNNTEYWTIEQSSGSGQIFLTLSLDNETTSNEILNSSLESIHIARWDSDRQLWMDQGGVPNIGNQSVSALVENFGVFTLAGVEGNTKINYPLFLTPNNDGYNDTWNIESFINFEVITIQIFDRFGKLLKQLNPEGYGWDGTFNGKLLPSNDYWFIVNYLDLADNAIKQFRSHFSLKY